MEFGRHLYAVINEITDTKMQNECGSRKHTPRSSQSEATWPKVQVTCATGVKAYLVQKLCFQDHLPDANMLQQKEILALQKADALRSNLGGGGTCKNLTLAVQQYYYSSLLNYSVEDCLYFQKSS